MSDTKRKSLLGGGMLRGSRDLVTQVVRQVATKPKKLVEPSLYLAGECTRILTGRSELAPAKGDRRFTDEAWQQNFIYRSVMQGYLACEKSADDWVSNLGLSHRNEERARLLTNNLLGACSPTNTLIGNPAALKQVINTGGGSLRKGAGQLWHDLRNNGAMPSQVDKQAFKVGESLATTPGRVVFRNDMLELIQYQPTTKQVYKRPLMFVPPQINKFYVYDLSPGRSLIEYAVSQGFKVYAVSWRNPGKQQRDWGFADYVKALDKATEVVCEIAGSEDLNILGSCSGGITVATLLAYQAAREVNRVNSLSLMVSVLDPGEIGDTPLGLFAQRDVLELAKLVSRSKGVLRGQDLGKVFSWLRPNDLIWSYWVNNYLLGKEPPAFDILFWNNDTTNLSAQLHADFLNLIDDNPLVEAGKLDIDGTPIDLKQVMCDALIVGGSTDHITPWQACYRTVDMLGGKTEFVLSTSGHIQAIINPPGNPKAKYRKLSLAEQATLDNESLRTDPDVYLAHATEQQGSWWEYWQSWLGERSGRKVNARKTLGQRNFPPLDAAPGTYVTEQAD